MDCPECCNARNQPNAFATTGQGRSARIAKRLTKRQSSLLLDDSIRTDNSSNNHGPRFTFGIMADIQYANIPDGYSYSGARRYYRHSLQAARHAAEHFQQLQVPLVLNLGDIIDGKCQNLELHGGERLPEGVDPGHQAVEDVVGALSSYRGLVLHTYGNHELYNLDRHELGRKLDIPFVKEPCGDLVGYRFHVHDNVRFVILDSYDIAMMRRCPKTSRKYQEASRILAKNNPNFPELGNSADGLNGLRKRFVAFNGAIDEPQLDWLRNTLEEARNARQKVIVLSHQPILPGSSNPVCLVWNYKDVLDILRKYSDVVVASLSGHAHKGGYKRDASGIHFRVVEASLESPHPLKTYGLVDMYDDRMVIRGYGNCSSAIYEFDHHSHVVEPDPSVALNTTDALR